MDFLGFLAAVEIVAEDLLEEYRQSSDSAVVDALDFVAYEMLCLIAQRDHQFTHFPVNICGSGSRVHTY